MQLHRHPFVRQVDRALADACRIVTGDRLLLAVSGGADSMALLRAVDALARRNHWLLQLKVVHVDHRWRPESAAEGRWVIEQARALGWPGETVAVDCLGPGNAEANARRARYAMLQARARLFGASAILLGHQADDHLETVLMRLMRGAGLGGLAGLRWRRRLGEVYCCRPMLGCSHDQAKIFLDHCRQDWLEDPTNTDRRRVRSRLRHEVLPVLKTLAPGVLQVVRQDSDLFDAMECWYRQQVQQAMEQVVGRTSGPSSASLPRQWTQQTDRILVAGVVRQMCLGCGASADRLGSRRLMQIVDAARQTNGRRRVYELGRGWRLMMDRHRLWIAEPPTDDSGHGDGDSGTESA